MLNPFQNVQANRPGKSAFNLTHTWVTSCDMGEIIPICLMDVIPSDFFQIGANLVIRFQPLIAPILHEINATVHYFFVPYRILWDDWVDFITGGEDGADASTLPTWNVTSNSERSLWDHLGFPIGIDADGARPVDFPRRAYAMIYNEFYRDENIITEVALTNEDILKAAWEKDYLSSCLPWQQRGTAPAVPLTGTGSVDWPAAAAASSFNMQGNFATAVPYDSNTKAVLENNSLDFTAAGTFNIADLRLITATQIWMERNARAGARYVEWLYGHFGVKLPDSRLQRPEYIGGTKFRITISEVLGTNQDNPTDPHGQLAGHGLAIHSNFCGSIKVEEYGLIMGLLVVRPRTSYHQGINRQWMRSDNLDYYHPAFAHLSEQEVYEREVYASGVQSQNETILGYQGVYNEYRYCENKITGNMHADFDHWHMCRQFSGRPSLNQAFIECDPRKDAFAVPAEDAIFVEHANLIRAVRPLPLEPTPSGLGV